MNQEGQKAENMALHYLLKEGLKFIAKNYRCKYGEIDLIMQENETLVFVEVRYRTPSLYGDGALSVTLPKQKRLIKSAQHYLLKKNLYDKIPCRLDILSIGRHPKETSRGQAGSLFFDWIKNAITLWIY